MISKSERKVHAVLERVGYQGVSVSGTDVMRYPHVARIMEIPWEDLPLEMAKQAVAACGGVVR